MCKLGTIAESELSLGDTPCTFYTYSVERYTGFRRKSPHPRKERAPNRGPPPKKISRLSGSPTRSVAPPHGLDPQVQSESDGTTLRSDKGHDRFRAVVQASCEATTAVDLAKMHACNGMNITNMPSTILPLTRRSARLCVPLQKFILVRLCTEKKSTGQLPAGLSARQPTPCPWSSCSTIIRTNIISMRQSQGGPTSTSGLVGCATRRDVHVRGFMCPPPGSCIRYRVSSSRWK